MTFRKYQHLERFGTPEVDGIQIGKVHVFPKIDGTNASVWFADGELKAGSRNRLLEVGKDNAGFLHAMLQDDDILAFLMEHPHIRLYGEWLVPHSLKTYREKAWRKFYVFDVFNDETEKFIPYSDYQYLLDNFNINYIPPMVEINNPSYEQLVKYLESNQFLIQDGKGAGEGIVIKNYDFVNRFGRVVWAKMVTSEFREKHAKEMGHAEIEGARMVEVDIADEYVTQALCDKVMAKIENSLSSGDQGQPRGFSSKDIPRYLNTVFYDVVKEESWNFVKKFKNPSINFKTLQHFVFAKARELNKHNK